MGNFAPIFLAFLLNCVNVYIFRSTRAFECCPYISYVIFLVAAFCLLWDLPVNPFPLFFRKLFSWVNFVIEFLFSKLLMETIVIDFWLPLQKYMVIFLPRLSDYLANVTRQLNVNFPGLYELLKILKWPQTLIITNYAVSTFFLFCLAHATRTVDFRLLRCGGDVFINDVKRRSKLFLQNMMKKKRHRTRGKSCSGYDGDGNFSTEWEPPEIFDSTTYIPENENRCHYRSDERYPSYYYTHFPKRNALTFRNNHNDYQQKCANKSFRAVQLALHSYEDDEDMSTTFDNHTDKYNADFYNYENNNRSNNNY